MANVKIDESCFTDIANAIRALNGKTTTYKPSEMANAISQITGADVTDYDTLHSIVDRSATKLVLPGVTILGKNCLRNFESLTEIDLPDATYIGSGTFDRSFYIKRILLRSNTICDVGGSFYNALGTQESGNSPFLNGTGRIYVPSNLVDSYKANSQWKDFASMIRSIDTYPY